MRVPPQRAGPALSKFPQPTASARFSEAPWPPRGRSSFFGCLFSQTVFEDPHGPGRARVTQAPSRATPAAFQEYRGRPGGDALKTSAWGEVLDAWIESSVTAS